MSYQKDKHYGTRSYSISSDVEQIQTEIMNNGPVEGAFTVYADFPTYRSGKQMKIVRLKAIFLVKILLFLLACVIKPNYP